MQITDNIKQDDEIQKIMTDIVFGVKTKLINPIIEENIKLNNRVNQIHTDLQELSEIKYRLDRLEETIRESPLLILTAIREALNQSGTGDNS